MCHAESRELCDAIARVLEDADPNSRTYNLAGALIEPHMAGRNAARHSQLRSPNNACKGRRLDDAKALPPVSVAQR